MQGHLLLVALLFMGMFYNTGAPGTLDRMEESIFILLMTLNIDELLRLELTSAKHASGLFQAVDNNRQHLSEFLTWVDKTKTINDIGNHIKACELLNGERKEVNYTIVYDDVVVGRIGLHHINLLHKNASIGYWIAKDSEGKGIMLRSCTALINHGFSELNLNRMDIRAATNNVRSRAVAERLGFSKEGILREAELVNNQFQDLVLYSILRKEWQRATNR